MPEHQVAQLPETVFRIGRLSDPMRFSQIRPDDANLPKAGNRYDVPGGKVLYAATQVRACFGETLARYRPTPRIRALLAEPTEEDESGSFMVCGGVPQDWRLARTIVSLSASDPQPFLDVEAAGTHAMLSAELANQMVALGYSDNLDLSDVHSKDRRLSRAIAEWAYTKVSEDGDFLFSGIRYLSRVDASWECWAIFDGTDVYETGRRGIDLSDSDLEAVADMWDLRPF